MKFKLIFLFIFLGIVDIFAFKAEQKKYLECFISDDLRIESNYFNMDKELKNLKIILSENGDYTYTGDSVSFLKSGDIKVNLLLISKDNDSLKTSLLVEVKNYNYLTFDNSNFDYLLENYKIPNWYCSNYGEATIINDVDTNKILYIKTLNNDSVQFMNENASTFKVERNGVYRLRFNAKSSSNVNDFRAYLLYGQFWQYKEYEVRKKNISNEWNQYSLEFEAGINGSFGVAFSFYNKNTNYSIDNIVIEKWNTKTLNYDNIDFENGNFQAEVNDDSLFYWKKNNLLDSKIEDGYKNKAGVFTTGELPGSIYTLETKAFNLTLGNQYAITTYVKASVKNAKLRLYYTKKKTNQQYNDTIITISNTSSYKKYIGNIITSELTSTSGIAFEFLTPNCTYYIDEIKIREKDKIELPTDYRTFYVSEFGNESGVGTKEEPFALSDTIFSNCNPGDKLLLMSGHYVGEWQLNNINGTKSNPVVVESAEGANVVFDGTKEIKGTWKKVSEIPGAWKLSGVSEIQQMWVKGVETGGKYKMQTLARWPNIKGNFSDTFNFKYTARSPEPGTCWDFNAVWNKLDLTKRSVTETYSNWTNLDARKITKDYTGGICVLKLGYDVLSERILSQSSDLQTLTTTSANYAGTHKPNGKEFFYIVANKNCLDAPREWYWDKAEQTLYWIPENGADPNNFEIRGKISKLALDIENSNGVKLKNLKFFGTTVSALNSHNVTIEGCQFDYPSYASWMLSEQKDSIRCTGEYSPTYFSPADVILYNNIFRFFDGYAFELAGQNSATPKVINNLIYNGRHNHMILMHECNGAIFERNRVFASQKGCGLKYTSSHLGKLHAQLNYMYDVGTHRSDGSMIQISTGSQIHSYVHNNWFYDSDDKGVRCDGEPGGELATLNYNVGWNLRQGMQVKGRDHTVVNNTYFNCNPRCDLTVLANADFGGNSGTRTYNNAGERISGHRVRSILEFPLPGEHGSNWIGLIEHQDINEQLRDPDNLDFRPKENSVLVNNGNMNLSDIDYQNEDSNVDIGAYESNCTNYWIPGNKLKKASMPIPPNKSLTAKIDCNLMWLEGLDVVEHRVYFGTDKSNLPLVAIVKNSNIYVPSKELDPTKIYYWRIDEVKNNNEIIKGDVWYFVAGGKNKSVYNLPVSYEETFNKFDAGDPKTWKDINFSPDFMKDDSASILNEKLYIDPVKPQDGTTSYFKIENLNMNLKDVPLMQFDYTQSKSVSKFYIKLRVIDSKNRVGNWVDLGDVSPSFDEISTKMINISDVFDAWFDEYGESNWTYLKDLDISFYMKRSEDFGSKNELINVDNFKLGLNVLDDYEKTLYVISQDSVVSSPGKEIFVGVNQLKLAYKVPSLPEGRNIFPISNYDNLLNKPFISIHGGDGYEFLDNIVMLHNISDSLWNIPLDIDIGSSSVNYNFIVKKDNNITGIANDILVNRNLVFPNPALNSINMYNKYNDIKIYSKNGKLVIFEHRKKALDISFLACGTYYIIVEDRGEKILCPFTKTNKQ